MLYVFQVNTGTMLTLDMALTMESVQRLQESIEDEYQIAMEKQVLLISGGQSLDPHMRVCSYSAGTDTNPIFLFSKGTIESASPPITSSISQGKEDNLKFQVEGLKNLPHSYSAVVSRTQLALQFHDLAKEKLKSCEAMVLDQHLQQQGWMAVVANLEDITSAFEQRSRVFQQNMTEFLKERPDLAERLSQFNEILEILEKTPLLPSLMAEGAMSMGQEYSTGEESSLDSGMTLMKWISSQDQRSTLQQMAQQCSKALEQFSQVVLDTIASDMITTVDSVNNPSMKEVKGLGDRLFGLEQLLVGAKKYLLEQAEMAQGMVQNQTRASNLNDDSVLPDLCKSHQQQLNVMYKKHCQLTEISRRCQAAKEELCQNLHVRLRWIMYVEQQISGVHGKMVVYHENLKRLRKRLEIVRQVYAAPELYVSAVVEVYRRTMFVKKFHEWAGQVSELSIRSHQLEVARRKEFASNMERHFLNALFPGLGDYPPMFATQPPGSFDTKLPAITLDDVQLLRERLPELSKYLVIPLLEDFFVSNQEPIDKNWIDIETQTQSLVMITKDDTDIIVIERDKNKDFKEDKIEKANLETTSIDGAQPTVNCLSSLSQMDEFDEDDADIEGSETPTRLEGSGSSPSRPDELMMHSFDPKQLENFVSAPTTPDSIPDMEMSVRGETPFASLLSGGVTSPVSVGGASLTSGGGTTDGYFYSAVTSPSSERFAFASNPASYRSSPTLMEHPSIEEIEMLKQMLQEKELRTMGLEEESKIIQEQLLEKDQALQNALDETHRTTGALAKSEGLVKQLEKCMKCELQIIKEKYIELHKQFSFEKDKFTEGFKTLIVDYQKTSGIVQSSVEKDKKEAIQKTISKLQEEHMKEIEDLNRKLQDASQTLEETKIQLGQNQEALKLKAMEVGMIRDESAQEVAEMKNKMQSEQKEAISALRMELAMELSDLETENQEKNKLLEELKLTIETDLTEQQKRLTAEKLDAVSEIKRDWKEKHAQEMTDLEKRLCETHLTELSEFQMTHLLKIDDACEEISRKVEAEKVEELDTMRAEMEKLHETVTQQLRDEHEAELAKQNKEHWTEIENMKEDIVNLKEEHKRAKNDQSLKVSQMEESFITEKQSTTLRVLEEERRHHQEQMQRLREELDRERNIAVADALGAANDVHSQEMEEIMKRSTDSSTTGNIDGRKTVETAEMQVSFNEAISRVAAKKDRQIEELKTKEAKLLEEQSRNKDSIEKLLTDKVDLDSEMSSALHQARGAEKDSKFALREREKEIQELHQRLEVLQRKRDSPAELPVTAESDVKTLDASSQDKLRILLRAKEQECNTLKQQVIQLRSISSHGSKSERISIVDISSGDLVLIFFEEPKENYVVFSVEPTLYFVHSESLTALGLKQHGSSGPKRQWIIGRVVDKEYCQAKKAQNRFKVAIGTKFYRVKAVPYDMKQEQVAKK